MLKAMGVFEDNLFSFAPTKEEALMPTKVHPKGVMQALIDFSPIYPLAVLFVCTMFNQTTILMIIIALALSAVLWLATSLMGRYMFDVQLYDAHEQAIIRRWPVKNIVVMRHPTKLSEHVRDMARRGITLDDEQIALINKVEEVKDLNEFEDELEEHIFSK